MAEWVTMLAEMARDVDDAERIDQIRVLEELKAAAAAAQARASVDLDVSQRHAQAAAGVPAARRGIGVGAQVALARRESPHTGGRHLGLAKALVLEMPHTHAALTSGAISEWRATLLVRESACLARADRATFDEQMAGDVATLTALGDRHLVAQAKKLAYALDPAQVVARARRAETERTVTLRPAPDTMTYLTALLPVAQGVAAYAALTRDADTRRSQGESRTRGQVMADTLVERLTGQAAAEKVPLEVGLIMTGPSLLADDDEPAHVPGYGPVPAGWARDLVRGRLDDDAGVWVRRLFHAPGAGELTQLDSRARLAPAGLARFVTTRDRTCRTPWCDAPIRHQDHITPWADGGATTADNLQGLCEACNHSKQAPGWQSERRAGSDRRHTVATRTPTGHEYLSHAPPLVDPPPAAAAPPPSSAPPTAPLRPIEVYPAVVNCAETLVETRFAAALAAA